MKPRVIRHCASDYKNNNKTLLPRVIESRGSYPANSSTSVPTEEIERDRKTRRHCVNIVCVTDR